MKALWVGRFPRAGMALFVDLRMDGEDEQHKRANPIKDSHSDSHIVTSGPCRWGRYLAAW